MGITSYVELEARWANQGFLNFSTTHSDAYLLFYVKDTHTCIGNNLVHMCKYTTTDGNLDAGTTGNNSIQNTWDRSCYFIRCICNIVVIILIGISKTAIILKHGPIYQ